LQVGPGGAVEDDDALACQLQVGRVIRQGSHSSVKLSVRRATAGADAGGGSRSGAAGVAEGVLRPACGRRERQAGIPREGWDACAARRRACSSAAQVAH
jgi:hypothetical protein